MISPAFARAPTPKQTAEAIRLAKTYRRQGGSFDAEGGRTLTGGSYDAWIDAQPWPEPSEEVQ